jgi:hypothetical protein
MDRIALHSFMVRHRFGVVSSISGDGTPQSALVGIAVTPQLEIIFDTVRSSRKYPNLIARPVCSFVVGWAGEQTVQFEGHAAESNGPDLKNMNANVQESWTVCRFHLICCFFAIRFAMISLTADSTKPVDIRNRSR